MSLAFEYRDAWILDPYCFCKDRPWLTVDGVRYIEGGDGDGGVVVGKTDPDGTALLAALLTALAIFLSLLFLLLCLLCPWGLCCGRKGLCYSKASKEKRSHAHTAKSEMNESMSSSNSVNLTAVDMKIPRPWTDNLVNSDLDHKKKYGDGWGEGSVAGWWSSGKGVANDGFKDGGWFSSSDLDSIYGKTSVREPKKSLETSSKKDVITMEEFYRGFRSRSNTGDRSTKSNQRHYRRGSYSDIVDKLMTPIPGTDNGGRVYDNEMAIYSNRLSGNDGESRMVEAVKVKSANGPVSAWSNGGINAMSEISINDRQNAIALPGTVISNSSVPSPPSYAESHMNSITISPDANQPNTFGRLDMNLPPNVISEVTSSYKKRTVEETETTTPL